MNFMGFYVDVMRFFTGFLEDLIGKRTNK